MRPCVQTWMWAVGCAVLCAMALPGCGDATADAPTAAGLDSLIVITDAMGRDVTIAGHPKRVVALAPFAVDLLLELGVTPTAAPKLSLDKMPEEWADLRTVAVNHAAGPNLEQLLATNPDLVIASSVHAQFVSKMESLLDAPVVVWDVHSIADVQSHATELGRMLDREAEAAAYNASLTDLLEGNSPKDGEASSTRLLAVFGSPHAFYAFLPSSYLGDLVTRAGGTLLTEGMASHKLFRGLAPLTVEAIVARDPDAIMLMFHGPEAPIRAMLESDPLWGSLRAVRTGRVQIVTEDLFVMRPGVQIGEAFRLLRRLLTEKAL